MTKKRFKKILSRRLILPLLVLVAGLSMVLAHPSKAFAYIDTDKKWDESQQHDRTELAAIAQCFNASGGLPLVVTGSAINQQAIWGDANSKEMPLGYEIDPDNGERQCQNLDYDGALSLMGMNWQSFINTAYGNQKNGFYPVRPGASQKLENKILSTLKNDRDPAKGSVGLVGPKEAERRILIGLTKCIQSIPDGKVATNPPVATSDKNVYSHYEWQDGVDGGHTVNMGFDLTADSSNDGTFTCDTLVHLGHDAISKLAHDKKTLEDVTGTTGSGGGGSASSDQLGCEATSNPLSWVICPLIDYTLVPAIKWTDSIITNQMVIPAQNIFCTGGKTCDAYYSAWASFRDIALGLLAIAGLIVVIAQAIGMEILDAYTIRKMLPRILIAAVSITLSWTLMNFAVTLSNNLGLGIRDLIVAPFNHLSSTINLNFSSSWIANFFGGAAGAVIAIPIWIAGGGIGVLLSYIATAGLAVLVAILVLILRQIAVTLLILISPIALIAYVLPNTQRIFRLWWESFSRALLMFPLIAAFIAAGRVFSAIALTGADNGVGGAFQGILGFVAYFAPYFMIPLTFSMSGSMMGGLGNMINSRAEGARGLLSNYRKGQAQSRVQRARAEGLYRPGFGQFKLRPGGKQRSVGKALNTIGWWGLNADEMVPYKLGTTKTGNLIDGKKGIPGFRRGGQALESQIKRARRDQTVKAVQDLDIGYKSGRLMSGQFQYFYGALDGQHQAELDNNFAMRDDNGEIMRDKRGMPVGWNAPNNWGERNKVADIIGSAQGAKGIEAREAAGELRATASEFEKYTGSAETNRVDGRLLGLLSAAKAGRLEMEDVADNYNHIYDNGHGDQETAVRETTLLQDALTGKRVSAARGHGMWWDEKGNAHSSYENPLSAKAGNSLMRINNQEIAGSKSEDLDALRETMVAHGSEYEMEMGEDGHVRRKLYNGKPRLKKDPIAQERARQVQARLKTLAQYNYGDSDVGVKTKEIWQRLGNNPDDLTWGKGGSTDVRRAADMAEAAQQQQQQPEPPEPRP